VQSEQDVQRLIDALGEIRTAIAALDGRLDRLS
jgi:hypothetical protein